MIIGYVNIMDMMIVTVLAALVITDLLIIVLIITSKSTLKNLRILIIMNGYSEKNWSYKMNKLVFTAIFLFSLNSVAQDVILPNDQISPFSAPEDCRLLQYNAAVMGKKVVEIYEKVEDVLIENPQQDEVEAHLKNAKQLADISLALTKQYEVFCKRSR